jgi:GAF domain-containing protein
MSLNLSTLDLFRTFDAAPSLYFILDMEKHIQCCNRPAAQLVWTLSGKESVGRVFYDALGKPKFIDGDPCPLHIIRQKMDPDYQTHTFLEITCLDGDEEVTRYYEMIAKICAVVTGERAILVSLHDVTKTIRDKRYLDELFEACGELHHILDDPQNRGLTTDQLREQLVQPITAHFNGPLHADAFETRLFDPRTKTLPLFITSEDESVAAYKEVILPEPSDNGITGFVASSRETYICDDVRNDPNYQIGGIEGASCSITSPILYGDELLGVVNIESKRPNAFTRREQRPLEYYLTELGRVLNRARVLGEAGVIARAECARQLRQRSFDAAVEALSQAVEACASPVPRGETEELERRAYLRGVRDALRVQATFVDAFATAWERPTEPPANAEEFADLRGRRVLLVDRDLRFLQYCVEQYEAYGLVVDVATSSKIALEMAYTFDYDLVVCELTPDGEYFSEKEKGLNNVNEFKRSLYDVHLPNYGVPNEALPRDAEIRGRILEEIASGKLDAYFVCAMLHDFRPEHAPEFLGFFDRWRVAHPRRSARPTPEFLISRDGSYDPLHIPRDLNDHFQLIPFTIFKEESGARETENNEKKLLAQLKQLQKAVRRRDA